jgi:hypothetical protein
MGVNTARTLYYLHQEGAELIAKHLHEENSKAVLISHMWNVIFRI